MAGTTEALAASTSVDLLKAVLSASAIILAPLLAAFLPLIWKSELKSKQQETEVSLKRLELIEKAVTIAAQTKKSLELEVDTNGLRTAFEQVIYEFNEPIIQSRKNLEHWATRGWWTMTPAFFAPFQYKRIDFSLKRRSIISNIILISIPFIYLKTYNIEIWIDEENAISAKMIVGMLMKPVSELFSLSDYPSRLDTFWFLYAYCCFLISTSLVVSLFRLRRNAFDALRTLRSIEKAGISNGPSPPQDAAFTHKSSEQKPNGK